MTLNKSPKEISCELPGGMQEPSVPGSKPTLRLSRYRMSTLDSAQPKTFRIVSQSLVITLYVPWYFCYNFIYKQWHSPSDLRCSCRLVSVWCRRGGRLRHRVHVPHSSVVPRKQDQDPVIKASNMTTTNTTIHEDKWMGAVDRAL